MDTSPYTITLDGADVDTLDGASYVLESFRILEAKPRPIPLYQPIVGWGGGLKARPGTRDTINIVFDIFTIYASEQDEGDLQRLRAWHGKKFHRLVSCDAPWWDEWYSSYAGVGAEVMIVPDPLQETDDTQYACTYVKLTVKVATKN